MLSHKVQLIAHFDPLKYLMNKATLTRRLAWVMILSELYIEYVNKKAIKGHIIAYQLAEAPLEDSHLMVVDFLDESIFTLLTQTNWKLYFDGSHTNHGAGAIILFITPQGDSIPKSFRINFPCTNNIAEYEALVIGICTPLQWKIMELQVFRDSQLIINRVNDDYSTKYNKLTPYKELVDEHKQYFTNVTFEQIPRAQKKDANAMAIVGSLLDIPKNGTHFDFQVEQLIVPPYEIPSTEYLCMIT